MSHLKKILMYASVFIKFGMKGRGQLIVLSCSNDMTIYSGYGLASFRHYSLNVRRTYESHRSVAANSFHIPFCMKTPKLPALGSATHLTVHRAKSVF